LKTAGEGNLWIPKITTKSTSSGGSKDFPYLFVTFKWDIFLTNPKTGSTVDTAGPTSPGSDAPVYLGSLIVKRRGAAKDKGDLIWLKQFQMNGSTNILFQNATPKTVCYYNANDGSTPAIPWGDSETFISTMYNGFKKIAGDNYGDEAAANPARKTADAILANGKKLITDIKAVFNSIELVPITPEGKKIWKGMKSV
jgi:hypothetical protein